MCISGEEEDVNTIGIFPSLLHIILFAARSSSRAPPPGDAQKEELRIAPRKGNPPWHQASAAGATAPASLPCLPARGQHATGRRGHSPNGQRSGKPGKAEQLLRCVLIEGQQPNSCSNLG